MILYHNYSQGFYFFLYDTCLIPSSLASLMNSINAAICNVSSVMLRGYERSNFLCKTKTFFVSALGS
jgi:hypothetical protein